MSKITNVGLGKIIKKRRDELGITQLELAKRMGYSSKAAISRVENGDDNLTTPRVVKFAKALECTPGYLMGWEDNLTDDNAHAMARMIKGEPVSPALYQYAVDAVLLQKINSLNEEEKKQVHNFVDFLISKKVAEENN